MSPVSWMDGWAALIDRAGTFATYGAGLGAAGGALAANAKANSVDNGFELGAAYGALAGLVGGFIFEDLRLSFSPETKEAGDANEKMKFLALKDKSILYTHYSTAGYVYFSPMIKRTSDWVGILKVTIPLVRGDPSKDWASPMTNAFPKHPGRVSECAQRRVECEMKFPSNSDKVQCAKDEDDCNEKGLPPKAPDRYEEFDLSPVVCACTVYLSPCNLAKNDAFICTVAGPQRVPHDPCASITNGISLPEATDAPDTSPVWKKCHSFPDLTCLF
jgi:hypothetical protein